MNPSQFPTEKFRLIFVMNTFEKCFSSAKKMRNDHLFPLFEWKGSVGLFFQCDRVVDRFQGTEELSLP